MENNDGEESLGDSFLVGGGHYIVQGDDGEDSLGGGMDSEEEEECGDDSKDGDARFEYSVREQDRFLPIANVARIMKKAIPKSGKIAKDARECVQECLSEFISFITSEASDRCHQEKRKTINGEDILFAMSTLGFDNYVEPLKLYLQKYREAMKGERTVGGVGGGSDSLLEEGGEDSFTHAAQALLTADQGVSQNVIYTTAYPTQVSYVL